MNQSIFINRQIIIMTSTTQICPDLIFTPSDDGPITHLITPKSSRANILQGTKMIRKFSFPISLHSSSLLSETSKIFILKNTETVEFIKLTDFMFIKAQLDERLDV